MLDFGFILLIIGSALFVWLKLSARAEMKALTPRAVILRTSAEESIRDSRKKGYREAYILIAIGALIIIFTGVMN